MGLIKFLHKQNNNKNVRKSIEEIAKPNVITIQRDGNIETIVLDIQRVNSIRHSDGTETDLIKAMMVSQNPDNTIYNYMHEPICLEVPKGDIRLLEEIVRKNDYKQQLPNDSYTYLGRAYSENDIRSQPPTGFVKNIIEKLDENLANQRKEEQESLNKAQHEREIYQSIKEAEQVTYINEQRNKNMEEKQRRLSNPYLSGGINGKEEEYNGINLQNGEILRLRGMKKIGKDAVNTYLYTAWLNSTPNETDVESTNMGVPVTFTVPYRMNDIVNGKFNNENAQQKFKNGILKMLTNGYLSSVNLNGQWDIGQLHDIGGIDLTGDVIEHKQGKNTSSEIIKAINILKENYTKEHSMPQKKEKEGR